MTIQIVTYLSFLFMISEFSLMLAKRSDNKAAKSQNDKKSLIIFWIVIPLSITAGFFLANYQEWQPYNVAIAYVGLAIFVTGILIRWLSIMQLKKDFTVDVAITGSHHLQTDGMYKKMRHPSYLGLLMIGMGLAIAMNSVTSFLVITIAFSFAIRYRIVVEETILLNEFGEDYIIYLSKILSYP